MYAPQPSLHKSVVNENSDKPKSEEFEQGHWLILTRITQAMIWVVCLQSIKLATSLDYFSLATTFSLTSHLLNLSIHLGLFIGVLYLVKHGLLYQAKLVLIVSFCSFISFACVLWQVNLHIQYYFLLSLFITCYLLNKKQTSLLYALLTVHLCLFLFFQNALVSIRDDAFHSEQDFLSCILLTNDIVFAVSCLICALFIRKIVSQNWEKINHYQRLQTQILKRVFPEQLLPTLHLAEQGLLDTRDSNENLSRKNRKHSMLHTGTSTLCTTNKMFTTMHLGVIFLDICNFTERSVGKRLDETSSKAESEYRSSIFMLFNKFDSHIAQFHARRIKTNGDQYITIIGYTTQSLSISSLACSTFEACKMLHNTSDIPVKVGAALGEVTCGVFDPIHPNFDIWGETVIRAARLESLTDAHNIALDENIARHLNLDSTSFTASNRKLKGLGEHAVFHYCLNS